MTKKLLKFLKKPFFLFIVLAAIFVFFPYSAFGIRVDLPSWLANSWLFGNFTSSGTEGEAVVGYYITQRVGDGSAQNPYGSPFDDWDLGGAKGYISNFYEGNQVIVKIKAPLSIHQKITDERLAEPLTSSFMDITEETDFLKTIDVSPQLKDQLQKNIDKPTTVSFLRKYIKTALASTIVATDNFNRADENPLGNGDWTKMTGAFDNLKIVTNTVRPATLFGNQTNMYWSSDVFDNDQYAQVVEVALINTAGVMLRAAGDDAYTAWYHGSNDIRITKFVNGSGSTLTTLTSVGLDAGETLKADVVGTLITVYVQGSSVGTYNDSSSPLTSGSAGLTAYGSSDAATMDDFEGGNTADAGGGGAINPIIIKPNVIFNRNMIFK